jgi:hypothetical protein
MAKPGSGPGICEHRASLMWSTVSEVYAVMIQPAPVGQVVVAEPQTDQGQNNERFAVRKINGVLAYENRGPISTLYWVAKC